MLPAEVEVTHFYGTCATKQSNIGQFTYHKKKMKTNNLGKFTYMYFFKGISVLRINF
jgi:hypothetical protein